jgi:hypothetical protein
MSERLWSLVKTKELLHSLVNNTSKTDIYRRRALIAMHDAIKHAYAEDLSIEQVSTISSVTKDILSLEKITRDDYRSLSKKIRKCGLRILPEPKAVLILYGR